MTIIEVKVEGIASIPSEMNIGKKKRIIRIANSGLGKVQSHPQSIPLLINFS